MNCKEFDDKISLYIDKRLHMDEEKNFLDHSKHCQHCRRALENTERMLDSLQDLNHIKAPKDISKNIIRALEMDVISLGSEDPQIITEKNTEESSEKILGDIVRKDKQNSVRETEQLDLFRGDRKDRFLKQMPWIKKVSLAAVLILVVTSAVILSTDWLPRPTQDDMMVMESGEESTLDERAADESEADPESPESQETQDFGEDIGITATEEGDGDFEDDAEEAYGLGVEDSEMDTFGIKHGEWIVLLLGIGVISVVAVLRKNRKN